MENNLFNLNFGRWDVILLSIVPALINFGIASSVFFSADKNRTTTYFSFFVFLLGIWQMTEGLMRMSENILGAQDWYRISGIFVVFVISFGVEFIIRFTKQFSKFSDGLKLLLLLLPAIIFAIVFDLRLEKHTVIKSEEWYWIGNPKPSVLTSVIYLWICLGAIVMLTLLWLYFIRSPKKSLERNQALLLAAGFTLPVIIGILTEVIFPLFFKWNDIPLATPLLTIFSITSLLAITKYKLLDYSPKHQWEKIIKSMNEGILIVDNNDNVMYANDTFCKIMGYEFCEIKGKVAHELFGSNEEQKKLIETYIEERKNKKSGQYEIELRTKQDKKIWMLISGSPYTNRQGEVVGSIGIHTNISHLKETNKELETFIYKASHDLRGPLTSIMGLVNVGRMEIKDENSIMYLNMIESSTKKLDSTLFELVKIMKIKDVQKFSDEINFKKLILAVLNKLEHLYGFSKLKVNLNISVSGSFISSQSLLETTFQNLIENAIKYQNTSQSESFLNIIITEENSKQIKVVLEDNGIGIDKTIQHQIFDMYFRGTERSQGSGLGLYLVRKSIERLNGEIQLSSELNKGTVFTIFLPL